MSTLQQKRLFLKQVSKGLMILLFLFGIAAHPVNAQVLFYENFESGWGDWWADNGVWEIGTPTAGPVDCPSPTNCAGTVLAGSYPTNTDSRLISPSITLSNVSGDEEIHLRFWQWFSYSSGDAGYVQISVYDEGLEEWSAWVTIGNSIVNVSPVWSLMNVELTDYAGQKVRIAFRHTADNYNNSTGWYIDDVQITKIIPEFTGDFESGWGDWSADRGVWEVGTPTAGPEEAHSPPNCAGTVLGGNYPTNTDSRLISPSIWLPDVSGDEELHLRFWHWFSYSSGDQGRVLISVYDEGLEEWSGWVQLGASIVGSSPVWSPRDEEITDHAGKKVRIAFYHTADNYNNSTGWYIDDVQITGAVRPVIPDVKANGQDLPIFVTMYDSVNFTISLDPGGMEWVPADWWIGIMSPYGSWMFIGQTYPLIELPETSLIDIPFPPGFWFCFFILDDNPNGILDRMTWYDIAVAVVYGGTTMRIEEDLPDFNVIFEEKMKELMNMNK